MSGKSIVTRIDFGASHHVTGNLNLLHNVNVMTECTVGLPDGKQTISTMQDEVQSTQTIVLQNVFYVPQLNCNLIFVTHLADDMNCAMLFTKTLCVIQDQQLRLIGVGKRREELYYFRMFHKFMQHMLLALLLQSYGIKDLVILLIKLCGLFPLLISQVAY